MASSWTQVYLGGLPRSHDLTDAEIEDLLSKKYNLSDSSWAGPETTLVKRDNTTGLCRGYAFLSFYSPEAAMNFVNQVNEGQEPSSSSSDTPSSSIDQRLPWGDLKAELSQPKGGKKSNQKKKAKKQQQLQQDYSDLRFRRQRGAPVRKHPVIVSSNGKRTNLGNKTR